MASMFYLKAVRLNERLRYKIPVLKGTGQSTRILFCPFFGTVPLHWTLRILFRNVLQHTDFKCHDFEKIDISRLDTNNDDINAFINSRNQMQLFN